MKKGKFSLQAIIIIFVCIVVAFSLGITDLIISNSITSSVEETQKEKALDVARMMAITPQVIGVLEGRENRKMSKYLPIKLKPRRM
jgi:two-component system, CitB family, sensor histidine kinase MalK